MCMFGPSDAYRTVFPGGIDDLFHEGAAEYSGLELHETDEEKEAAALSDDLFESGTETGDQGDED